MARQASTSRITPYLDDPNQQIDPATGLPIDPNTGQPIGPGPSSAAPQGSGADPFGLGGAPATGLPGPLSDTGSPGMNERNNRTLESQQGTDLINQTERAAGTFGQQADYFGQQGLTAYDQLAANPGYSADEAGKIGADYSQYRTTPGQLNSEYLTGAENKGISGDPRAAFQYYRPQDVTSSINKTTNQQNAATKGLQQGLDQAIDPNALQESGQYLDQTTAALQGEGGKISSALDPSQLRVDPNFVKDYKMSDADVQQIENQAATSVGERYQSQEDTMARQAEAQGNTSPMALAAMRAQNSRSVAVAASDAETNASIAAKAQQAQRAQTAESMRESDQQYLSGAQVGASETLGGQQVNAAQQEENTRLGAEQYLTGAKTNAATVGGEAGINTAYRTGTENIAGQEYVQGTGEQLAQTAEQQAQQRAQTEALNRQATDVNVNQTQFNQGVQTQQDTSAAAKTVADQRLGGLQQYRGFLTGEQGLGQQGYLTSQGQGIQAYGAQNSAINTAAANFATHSDQPGQGQQVIGDISNLANAFLEEGGIVTDPTVATVGENGPEAILPLGPKPPSPGGQSGESSNSKGGIPQFLSELGMEYGGIVTKPTIATLGERGPEAVVKIKPKRPMPYGRAA